VIEFATPYFVEEIDRPRCLELLSAAKFGRMVASSDCLPIATPVLLEVVERFVLVASPFTSVRLAAKRGDVVSIEVDNREDTCEIWSIHVTGVVQLVAGDSPAAAEAVRLPFVRDVEAGESIVAVPLTHLRGERAWWPETT
jgi:hypothetical protein